MESQTGRNYLQQAHLIMSSYPKCKKNPQNFLQSITKRQTAVFNKAYVKASQAHENIINIFSYLWNVKKIHIKECLGQFYS